MQGNRPRGPGDCGCRGTGRQSARPAPVEVNATPVRATPSIADSTSHEPPDQGHLPELRVAGRRSGAAHLRRAARRGPRGLVRPERAARRRRVGCVDPQADQGVRAVRAGHLGQHPGARRGLFPPRMESRRRAARWTWRTTRRSSCRSSSTPRRRQRARAGEVPRGAVDAAARGRGRRRLSPSASRRLLRAKRRRPCGRPRRRSVPIVTAAKPPAFTAAGLPHAIHRRSPCCRSST